MDSQNDKIPQMPQGHPNPEDEKGRQNGEVQENEAKNEAQVFTYTADWLIYALGFSSRRDNKFRLAIGSFLEENDNKIEIIQLNEKEGLFQRKSSFTHKYPPTKLIWIPSVAEKTPDLLATSGESLKIWEVMDDNTVKQKHDLINQSEFSAPLTSFDWNQTNLNLVGTASIDTTCTIWDLEKTSPFTQLIAHDKEVYDISFSPDPNIFGSVGADGSARQFDLRNLEHSTVLYETENSLPLLRIAWNKQDPNCVAVIAMDQSFITLLDMRHPLTPVSKLTHHTECVNALAWAPQSNCHLCTVADDCQALIWELGEKKFELKDPLLEYAAEAEITNLAWSLTQNEWLAICYNRTLQILKV